MRRKTAQKPNDTFQAPASTPVIAVCKYFNSSCSTCSCIIPTVIIYGPFHKPITNGHSAFDYQVFKSHCPENGFQEQVSVTILVANHEHIIRIQYKPLPCL